MVPKWLAVTMIIVRGGTASIYEIVIFLKCDSFKVPNLHGFAFGMNIEIANDVPSFIFSVPLAITLFYCCHTTPLSFWLLHFIKYASRQNQASNVISSFVVVISGNNIQRIEKYV